MPLGAKTLAPQTIRRDPRQMPIFCKNFNRSLVRDSSADCHRFQSTETQFVIRGREIGENRNQLESSEEQNDSIEEFPCSNCLREIEFGDKDVAFELIDKNALCMTFDDDYHLDELGNIPHCIERDSPSPVTEQLQRYALRVRRCCSPATSQVIRISVQCKSNAMR